MKGEIQFEVVSDTGVAWRVLCSECPHLHAHAFSIPDALEAAAKSLREIAVRAAMDTMDGLPPEPMFRRHHQ